MMRRDHTLIKICISPLFFFVFSFFDCYLNVSSLPTNVPCPWLKCSRPWSCSPQPVWSATENWALGPTATAWSARKWSTGCCSRAPTFTAELRPSPCGKCCWTTESSFLVNIFAFVHSVPFHSNSIRPNPNYFTPPFPTPPPTFLFIQRTFPRGLYWAARTHQAPRPLNKLMAMKFDRSVGPFLLYSASGCHHLRLHTRITLKF